MSCQGNSNPLQGQGQDQEVGKNPPTETNGHTEKGGQLGVSLKKEEEGPFEYRELKLLGRERLPSGAAEFVDGNF